MNVTVNVLSLISVENAIKDLDRYIDKLKQLEEELPVALAEYGVPIAQMLYTNAAYDVFVHSGTDPYDDAMQAGAKDIEVTMEKGDKGAWIVAKGEKVLFVEFGAGVYFNGDESYLGTRPEGISNIGEYGSGLGSNPVWGFSDEYGHHVTHGTPASNAMYFTEQEVIEHIAEVARRILNDG